VGLPYDIGGLGLKEVRLDQNDPAHPRRLGGRPTPCSG
jgi:hypothetical protein